MHEHNAENKYLGPQSASKEILHGGEKLRRVMDSPRREAKTAQFRSFRKHVLSRVLFRVCSVNCAVVIKLDDNLGCVLEKSGVSAQA
jgi:hypothetical protein